MKTFGLLAVPLLCAVWARAQVTASPEWPDGYWERQYGFGQQWSVSYNVSVKVASPAEAGEKAIKLIEQAGGRSAQGMYGYPRGGPSVQLAYLVPVEKAERTAKRMFDLGDLQQYSTQKLGAVAQLPEIRDKVASIEGELKANDAALAKMPVARALLTSQLARLTQSRDAAEASAKTALLNVVLVDAAAPDSASYGAVRRPFISNSRPPSAPGEGAAKGALGAIRSALSIFYGDAEGRYPASLSELTVGGKYLSAVPSIRVGGHPETDKVVNVTGVAEMTDLHAKLKDTGGWAYVSDPKSKLWGTLVIDCTHTDSRSTAWADY